MALQEGYLPMTSFRLMIDAEVHGMQFRQANTHRSGSSWSRPDTDTRGGKVTRFRRVHQDQPFRPAFKQHVDAPLDDVLRPEMAGDKINVALIEKCSFHAAEQDGIVPVPEVRSQDTDHPAALT